MLLLPAGLYYIIIYKLLYILYIIVDAYQWPRLGSDPPSCFAHISITTPIASALKNYYYTPRALFSRTPNGFFKPLLDPGDRFTSETVSEAKRLQLQIQNWNGHYATVSEAKRLQVYDVYMKQPFPNGHKRPFGCNGYMAKWPFAKASGFI